MAAIFFRFFFNSLYIFAAKKEAYNFAIVSVGSDKCAR